jgi:hypothetical protein
MASQTPSSSQPENPDYQRDVHIDESGDLTMIVGEQSGQVKFLVSTTVLRLASPVWKAMITGQFRESSAKEIPFPEDDAQAMSVILHLAHLRYKKVPKSMNFSDLVKLAVICDKYDVVSIVRPFLEDWVAPWRHKLLDAGYEEWLYLAWVFGYGKDFVSLASELYRAISTNKLGDCLRAGKSLKHPAHMPPGIVGKCDFPKVLRVD